MARLLLSNVQYQLVQVARFKEHLLAREALLKELERAEKERAKAAEDKQRSTSPSSANKRKSLMFSKGPEELVRLMVFDLNLVPFATQESSFTFVCQEDILVKKTEQVALLTARAQRLTKGLTFCEIHRFNKDRTNSIAAMLGTLAATHIQVKKIKWEGVVWCFIDIVSAYI